MTRQLAFDLPARPALGRSSFFVSPANEAAVSAVDRWRDWPSGKLVLTGPDGAGKTHLARVWAAETGARVLPPDHAGSLPPQPMAIVEDIDRLAGGALAEEGLFHLHNRVLAAGGRLLLTGRGTPALWPIRLPDLKSRVQGALMVAIAAPDDALLAAVMVKQFADRQLLPPSWLLPWVLPRMPRSFAAAARLVALLDADALARGRGITRASAHRALESVMAQG